MASTGVGVCSNDAGVVFLLDVSDLVVHRGLIVGGE